ncbi:regulatory protein RecX [Thermovibrio ammonificans]|uniref:Regulatory protein RecX n=1 Tax=Thermovibrio ammonificans (strain DSM 15698 / JCM 12110 / HB-1) TaxID=648996 RepID=E8T5I2_THEA1|nr:regulatory protein RecX [Thermovibrio ammonificans]ADU97636.1 regulatory protein RecX [Thermovibrio ammonificans HB-1]
MEPKEYREAYTYGLKLLSKRGYSKRGLLNKLKEKFHPEAAERAVEELARQGYLNDLELALSYFEEKVRKGWGRRKIALHLKALGFSSETVKEAELLTTFSYEQPLKSLRKKFPGGIGGRKEREKALRFLLQRGFSWQEAQEILKRFEEDGA